MCERAAERLSAKMNVRMRFQTNASLELLAATLILTDEYLLIRGTGRSRHRGFALLLSALLNYRGGVILGRMIGVRFIILNFEVLLLLLFLMHLMMQSTSLIELPIADHLVLLLHFRCGAVATFLISLLCTG